MSKKQDDRDVVEASTDPLERNVSLGMNPVTLLTGFYNNDGKRIKHQVHEGALRLPKEALDIYRNNNDNDNDEQRPMKKSKKYDLPSLDFIQRPSLGLPEFRVMTIEREEKIFDDDDDEDNNQDSTNTASKAQIKMITKIRVIKNNSADAAERIRGGGGDDDDNIIKSNNATNDANNNNTTVQAIPTSASVPVQSTTTSIPMATNQSMVQQPMAQQPTVGSIGFNPNTTTSTASSVGSSQIAKSVQSAFGVTDNPTGGVNTTTPAMSNPNPVNTTAPKPAAAQTMSGFTGGGVLSQPKTQSTGIRPTPHSAMSGFTGSSTTVSSSGHASSSTPAMTSQTQQNISTMSGFSGQVTNQPHFPTVAGFAGNASVPKATVATTGQGLMSGVSTTAKPGTSSIGFTGTSSTSQAVAPSSVVATTAPVAKAPVTPAPAAAATTTTHTAVLTNPPPSSTAANKAEEKPTVIKSDTKVTAESTTSSNVPPDVAKSSTSQEKTAPVPPPKVVALSKVPNPQWTHLKPNSADDVASDAKSKMPKPGWYRPDAVSDLERTLFPEWFDGSAVHRTAETYLKAREKIIQMSIELGNNRYVTGTMVRRSIPGDAGSLLRLHSFLTSYALINEDAINDTMPTPFVFQPKKKPNIWNDTSREILIQSVVEQSRKRRKVETDEGYMSIDWEEVATAVGNGVSALDCEKQFLTMPMDQPREGSITPDPMDIDGDDKKELSSKKSSADKMKVFKDLVESTDPATISVVTKAALESTNDLAEAQNASGLGLAISEVVKNARSEQDAVARILAEVVDLRMQKLENRMAMLDDVEGMLEAERIGLELERRDLYTARCRHWFGGT